MPEQKQNRVIHLVMSLLTIAVTLGGVFVGYSRTQTETEKLITRIEVRLDSQAARIAALEGARAILEAALQSDRLISERRVTSLEAFYSQVQRDLTEIKSDVKAMRDTQNKPRSP